MLANQLSVFLTAFINNLASRSIRTNSWASKSAKCRFLEINVSKMTKKDY